VGYLSIFSGGLPLFKRFLPDLIFVFQFFGFLFFVDFCLKVGLHFSGLAFEDKKFNHILSNLAMWWSWSEVGELPLRIL